MEDREAKGSMIIIFSNPFFHLHEKEDKEAIISFANWPSVLNTTPHVIFFNIVKWTNVQYKHGNRCACKWLESYKHSNLH